MGFIVAIDGPAGSGKGTVTKIVAERRNLVSIDTGAMYRCVALECINNNIEITNIEGIKKILENIDIELRNEGISIIKKAIVLAKKLGVKLIQLTAYDVYQKPSTSETRKLYEEGIQEVLEFNKDYGIILAIEVLEDVDHFNTSAKLVPFLKEIDSPCLKEYADTGNLVFNGFDPLQDLKDGMEYIEAIHIKDAILHNEHNIGYGQGTVDFKGIFDYLKQVNYEGYLVSECWYEEDYRPDIKTINQFIRRYML